VTEFPGYTFRQLSGSDVALATLLNRLFGEAFEDSATYQGAAPDRDYLARLLGKEHVIAVVAVASEEIVGGLVAYVLDKLEQDRREVYIYDLAVAEAHRRRGIATGLIRELQRIAAERRAYVIFVQADLEDAPAIALYESLGTRETAYHFDIPVTRRVQ
jgi:aminoglycoside 3-N-acetyltransferase I